MSIYPDAPKHINFHRGATYTVELGTLVESGFDLGLRDYSIFDEKHREVLNAKILDHYWFREIGLETPALFRRFLNRKMNEVMPFYNKLYMTESAEIEMAKNPIDNNDLVRTSTESSSYDNEKRAVSDSTTDAESTSTVDTDGSGKSRAMQSSTPQMQLSGREDYASNVADSANESKSVSKTDSDSTTGTRAESSDSGHGSSVRTFEERVKGLSSMSKGEAIDRARAALTNIDMMVVEELDGLFMSVYSDYWNAF